MSAQARAEQRWDKMPLAIQSFSLQAFAPSEVIQRTRQLGLPRIEFYHGHISPSSTSEEIVNLKKMLNKSGVVASAYGLYTFTRDPEHNRKAFEFATLLGVNNITANVDPNAFDNVTGLAEEYGIRVALHTSGPGTRYEKLDTLVADLNNKHELLGACIDTGHILRGGGDPVRWIDAIGTRVFVVHLTDVAQKAPQTHSQVLGKGHLDLPQLLNALNQIGFSPLGSISIGYQGASCARLDPPPALDSDPFLGLSRSLGNLGVGTNIR